ncbi:signal peptidase I [Enterococcus sp. LJL90]
MGQRKLEDFKQTKRPEKRNRKQKSSGRPLESSRIASQEQIQHFAETKTSGNGKRRKQQKNRKINDLSSKKADVSTKIANTPKAKGVLAKQIKTKTKATATKTARSHQPQPGLKMRQGKKSAKITIGKISIAIDKRFGLTIFFCVCLAGMMMLIISGLIRYRAIEVQDNLMAPTVQKNQQVAVDTTSRIQRYDLVAFHLSSNEFSGEYIRRVVGLPGDSIWVENQTIFVNGSLEEMISLRPQTYASQLPSGTYSFTTSTQSVIEELQGFSNIPSESYLVLTDSTAGEDADSREYGLVNQRNIQGVVTYRLWPLSQLGDI